MLFSKKNIVAYQRNKISLKRFTRPCAVKKAVYLMPYSIGKVIVIKINSISWTLNISEFFICTEFRNNSFHYSFRNTWILIQHKNNIVCLYFPFSISPFKQTAFSGKCIQVRTAFNCRAQFECIVKIWCFLKQAGSVSWGSCNKGNTVLAIKADSFCRFKSVCIRFIKIPVIIAGKCFDDIISA